ncbi:hypothetical protein HRbin22_00518 [Candidatus Thermoflexus japonica]|uniref:Uncharacterized protein n=1 Tax=Candidatus Thermoflexus japonica TaxID=2035417 RepID=A0A2H5Y4A7_9CHLR|nr:hypothetical protein HRbin22_00518 [Candidatus Thermoflexus japonica]
MTSLAIGSCITLLLFASVVIGAFWGNRRTRPIALSPVALFRAPTSITLQEAFHRFDEASTTRKKGDSLVGWKARPEMRMGILVDPNITSLDGQYDYPIQKAGYNGLAFLWEDWDGVGLLFVSHHLCLLFFPPFFW